MADTPEGRLSDTPPILRTYSPSPSPLASPSPSLSPCPPLERSVSAASTASTFSRTSSGSYSTDTVAARRRGYARPQGTSFAESARNRESVLSLGSITHLQHYFARTGLLDGKGGGMYPGKRKKVARVSDGALSDLEYSGFYLSSSSPLELDTSYPSMRSSSAPDVLLPIGRRVSSQPIGRRVSLDSSIEQSPLEEHYGDVFDDEQDPAMLPPTVSTYKPRQKAPPPPPSSNELRMDLRKSLVEARKMLPDTAMNDTENGRSVLPNVDQGGSISDSPLELESRETETEKVDSEPSSSPISQGWHQLQGLNVLDTMTLAIRAAKMYYTAHEQPARLAAIKSERKLRQDLYAVLDVLKRMAIRNFDGGVKDTERTVMVGWIDGVEDLLGQEERLEAKEIQELQAWSWMHGDWTDREREREWLFLNSFASNREALPTWTHPEDTSELPTVFLEALRNGLWLVCAHNDMVRKTRRQFGQITKYHLDTMKPYRRADNLRYWIKAAELRWDIVLRINVMGVVYGRGDDVWKQFDAEILRWCRKIREEVTEDCAGKSSPTNGPTDEGPG
ncbi:MAG: hypothetical protein M1816_007793 [Peltula sp. TS41687]|nr:MAG: hypothetical protein M1816_007793 [Peltula sp. TS41687]